MNPTSRPLFKGTNEPKKWCLDKKGGCAKPNDKSGGEVGGGSWPEGLRRAAQDLVVAIRNAEGRGDGGGKQRHCD